MNLEEREEDVVAEFRAMGATDDDQIQIAGQGDVAALTATLRYRRPALLIVDPLFGLIRVRDEKAYAEVYAHMGPLIDVARDTGTHIACLHHSPKQARQDAIDAPLGSTALGGAVSSLFALRRNPETGIRMIRSTQRVGDDLPEMVLRFDVATHRMGLDLTRQQFEVNTLKPMISTALGDAEMTEDQIFDILGHGKTGARRKALRILRQDGTLERSGSGKKGNPYLYQKGRSRVPVPVRNHGNENLPAATPQPEKMLVPSSSFLSGNEETRIHDVEDVRAGSAEMLVPEISESRLIRDDRKQKIPAASAPSSSAAGRAKSGYREVVL
jgi:hypothetical protein